MNNNNNNNNNNNSNNKKIKKDKKGKNKEKTRLIPKDIKESAVSAEQFFKTKDRGLIPAEEYKNEIIAKEKAKDAERERKRKEGIIYTETGDIVYPILELDKFLNSRRKIKAEEFAKLQDTEGFYFNQGLDDKELRNAKLGEGMYFIGLNIGALMDLFNMNVSDKDTSKLKGDVLSTGKSYELVGEYMNMEDKMEEILRDKMGYRLSQNKSLMPEKELNEYSTFENIVEEAQKYTLNKTTKLSPRSLYYMIKLLDKYKVSESQWLRSATAIEIIYKYLGSDKSRDDFFKSDVNIDIMGILELDEFFKSDHLFMTAYEMLAFKKELAYYKFNPEKNDF